MKIIKVLNNSSAIVFDKKREVIVMGNGVAFGKRVGDLVNSEKIEKSYVATPNFFDEHFQTWFEKISYQDAALAFDIVEYFKAKVAYGLNDIIYLSLSDHISFSIKRAKEKIFVPNAVLHEVQMFYPYEYKLGKWAIKKIKKAKGICLPEDEAGFIAMHIINARWHEARTEEDYGKMIADMITILNNMYKKDFRKGKIDYHRLVTHLKFFLHRRAQAEPKKETSFKYYDQIIQDYPEAYEGAEKISEYVTTFFKRKVTKEEKIYLTIHINRVLNN
ncbi:PRD domain-containing protein [Enterococcus sp. C50]|uniref:PRD domain-containing protein n=1 Tax=Enterococcus sp. C50 TaxID=3231311 RepID=UPI00349FFA65